jgi:hypothetical protein
VPARIRYTTQKEHIFYREVRVQYPGICEQLAHSADFAGSTHSWGDDLFSARARGCAGPGGPAQWVAADTNHHLELVAQQVWKYLLDAGLINQFTLPEPASRPWLQPALL